AIVGDRTSILDTDRRSAYTCQHPAVWMLTRGGSDVRCRFVQFGDVHLGTQQYNSPERLNDFGRAWLFACDYVARTRPDFAVCTGDLFNRFTINPTTFDQAFAGLAMLREAGVPIVDVAGNHDRTRYGEGKSWLESF